MALLRKGVLRLVACSSFIFLPLFAQERITVEKSSPETPATASETPIQTLYRAANQAARNRDYSLCAQFLEKVVAADRNYKNAWNYLGWTYNALGQYDKAEAALRNAIVVNPQDLNAYNNLGQALAHQKRYDEAIPEFQKQIEINAEDPWAHANLGRVYLLNKQYEKATAELEVAVTISPEDASVAFNLGRAYGKTKQPELAAEAFMKSVQLQPVPFRWNAVAYEMALDNLDLPQAEEYAGEAIGATVLRMRDTSLDHLTREDSNNASRIASYWDTWGWIRFQKGNLSEAENYVRCAWMIHPLSINSGDDELAPFAKDLQGVTFPNVFPEATELRLLRRGRLACARSSPDCRLQMISSLSVPTDERAATVPSVAGGLTSNVGRIRLGGNVQAARMLNNVQPVYPQAARQARIKGVVRLQVIVGKDGTIGEVEAIAGHPLL